MQHDHATIWEKLDLLRRHPQVYAGIVSRFGVDMAEGTNGMAEGDIHALTRHVEDCFRWFWPAGN